MIEALLAASIGVLVALGVGTFFLATLRSGKDMGAQTALQRQGTAVAEELSRRLRQANGPPVIEDPTAPPANCSPLPSSDSILVIPSTGASTCFYRDTASPPQIMRCSRPPQAGDPPVASYSAGDPCTPVANLMSGSLVSLSATAWSVALLTPCEAAGGTCTAGVCSIINQSCAAVPGARISFTLDDGTNRAETFGVAIVTGQGSRH